MVSLFFADTKRVASSRQKGVCFEISGTKKNGMRERERERGRERNKKKQIVSKEHSA